MKPRKATHDWWESFKPKSRSKPIHRVHPVHPVYGHRVYGPSPAQYIHKGYDHTEFQIGDHVTFTPEALHNLIEGTSLAGVSVVTATNISGGICRLWTSDGRYESALHQELVHVHGCVKERPVPRRTFEIDFRDYE